MSTYNPSIPAPGQFLSESQPLILGNFSKADTSFGIDHYNFSDATANNGKHNQVTTPAYVASPPTGNPPVTAANEPIFYAYEEPTTNLGVLQYSRGGNDAVPTPVTRLHSASSAVSIGAGSSINLLDFSNITKAFVQVHALNTSNLSTNRVCTQVFWNGSTFQILPLLNTVSQNLSVTNSGNVLRLTAVLAVNNVYWTLELIRVS